jgi:hypothetical protein
MPGTASACCDLAAGGMGALGSPGAPSAIGKVISRIGRYDQCMQERRSEVRMLCADVVEACWADETGEIQRANALLEDISASGACLQLETAVPLGVTIRWGSPKQEFTGEVRYCVYREIGYFVGVEFDSQSKWSKKTYKPQHLLDLQRLMTDARKPDPR